MAHAGGARSKLSGELINDAAAYVEPFRKEGIAKATTYIKEFADAQSAKNWRPADTPTNHYPTVEGLALHLDISRSTVYEWASQNKEFGKVMIRLLNRQAHILQNMGLIKQYDSRMANLLLAKHGYVAQSQVDNTLNFDPEGKAKGYMEDSDSPGGEGS